MASLVSTSSSPAAADAAAVAISTALGTSMTTASSASTSSVLKSPISTWTTPGGAFLSLLQLIPSILFWTVTFLTITLPGYMFAFFSTGLTITMNATTLILIVLVITSTVSWFVRYRFMDMYSMLPSEPQRKDRQVDLFPEVPEGDSKRGFSNYLDEFLSAIKVFGYLERPVFHELTRTVQTRKLVAGETLLLEEEKGFCLVVDGLVQIFVKSRGDSTGASSSANHVDDDDDSGNRNGQGYQLLTEVKNGAPLSSLFSILALFTEDVKLRQDADLTAESRPPSSGFLYPHSHSLGTPFNPGSFTPASAADSPTEAGSPRHHRKRHQRMASNVSVGDRTPAIPPLSLDGDGTVIQGEQPKKHSDYFGPGARQRVFESAHPDIVARATVDTTIAVIPATAFRRLTRTYPKATSHIVQVILTRLQRVTLTTGHAYLGLTSEVLNTEKLMNRFTTYNLPTHLRGAALDRLKEKFAQERDTQNEEERSKGIALHNPRAKRTRTLSSNLRREAAAARMSVARNEPLRQRPRGASHVSNAPVSPTQETDGVNAGDLLTLAHSTSRRGQARSSFSQPFQTASSESSDDNQNKHRPPSSFVSPARSQLEAQRQESHDEDNYFRDSTVDCMLKAIGLSDDRGVLHRTDSVPQSPHLVSYDSKKQKAFFSSAFGLIDALDIDAESESLVSVPASNASVSGGSGSIQEDLSSDVEIVYFPKDSVLVEQGERNPGLYYVIDGFLDVSVPDDGPGLDPTGRPTQKRDFDFDFAKPFMPPRKHTDDGQSEPSKGSSRKSSSRRSLYMIKPGGLAGYLGTITSRRSFANITAKTDVYVGFLSRSSIERIVEKYPVVLLTMAKRLTSLLPRLILHIDFALGWEQVDAGQTIFKQGDESDAIYIVLNGRLRMLRTGSDGKSAVIGEYGQGDSVGELEVLTESQRPGTLHAIRDTELAKLPKTLFNTLALENPEITIKISKIIATRMRDLTESSRLDHDRRSSIMPAPSATVNLRTVGILPVTSGVPVTEFGSRLLNALSQIGTPNGVTSLNQASILNHLGRHAFSRMGKLKLSQHLADLEEKFGLVLYIADTSVNSPWTQTCINQADCILLVGLAEGSPGIGEFERLLLTSKTTARKELVLLHAERYCPQGLTRQWLRNRMWINGSHHHIHMSFRNQAEPVHPQTRRFGSALKQRVQILQAEIQKYTSRRVRETPIYSTEQTPFKGDFHRLSRRLVGKSVGLVLGGGGARGLAHIGIIRALEEAGIPIDIVGGTSIGAFVGALYAWDADMVPLFGRAKKFAGRMGSMWRFALDLTYPSASYTTGHEFNRGIFKTFGRAQMEDFWLEFYCNTTNISHYRPEIHTTGYVWRYVRASMSLAGLVPPLCDDGSLLVDGGYLDNLTVSHMKSLGASLIFAVDVGALDDTTPQAYGDSLSGFWAAVNRWNPFSATPNPPTLSEVQARLAYVGSVDALERAKREPGVRYMRPPVESYGTLDFQRFEELVEIGAKFGREYVRGLLGGDDDSGGLLGNAGVLERLSGEERKLRRTMAPRRASI